MIVLLLRDVFSRMLDATIRAVAAIIDIVTLRRALICHARHCCDGQRHAAARYYLYLFTPPAAYFMRRAEAARHMIRHASFLSLAQLRYY